MRNVIVFAAILVSAAFVFSSTHAQREMAPIDDPEPVPTESSASTVIVENFPATQTVDVRNFPLTVTVEGTVDVGNLPLDADGNVRVAGTLTVEAPMIRVVGVTSNPISLPAFSGLAILNTECSAEFPNSRVCELMEVFRVIPPAVDMPLAWVIHWEDSINSIYGRMERHRLCASQRISQSEHSRFSKS